MPMKSEIPISEADAAFVSKTLGIDTATVYDTTRRLPSLAFRLVETARNKAYVDENINALEMEFPERGTLGVSMMGEQKYFAPTIEEVMAQHEQRVEERSLRLPNSDKKPTVHIEHGWNSPIPRENRAPTIRH